MEATIAKILPFWGRVSVIPSPVDEAQLDSGLVVPMTYDGDDDIRRGVVQAIDLASNEQMESPELLVPGTVVYYRNGVRILDVIVVERNDIIAYEA